jgi:RNA polymerase sigma-70 factor (ECF subfamily)
MPRDADSDPEQLLRLARTGDPVALGQLLEMYRNYLALLARLQIGRRLRGKIDSEDQVQDTFLKAHCDFPLFHGSTEAQLAAWLRQILSANLAMCLRRYLGTQRRDVRLERELADAVDQSSQVLDRGLIAPQSTPSQRAIRREQAVLLADELEKLPTDSREVIVLRHLEELSFPEVARRMGRSVDRVQKLWVRALARLRQTLGETP